MRASRASVRASMRSSFRLLSPISTSRAAKHGSQLHAHTNLEEAGHPNLHI